MPAVRYIADRIRPTHTVVTEVRLRAVTESADYADARMQKALAFTAREEVLDYALSKRRFRGLLAEFGVWKGVSLTHIAKAAAQECVYGFDSFHGLKEDWAGTSMAKGTFDQEGRLPVVPDNVRLVPGWFDESLPPFLASVAGDFSFLHVDCDTYESTLVVLNLLGSRIREGTVVVFDEYFGYRGWRLGEFRAWKEFVDARGIGYEYLAFSSEQVAVIVTDIANPVVTRQ